MRQRGWLVLGTVLVLFVAYNAWVAAPVAFALKDEHRVTVVAYRQWGLNPQTIVFDIWRIDGEASMADVDRNLFEAAARLRNRSYERVVLACRGRARFLLPGEYFREIGTDWETENPLYLVRTLPEHVAHLDGSPAFGSWSGGLLGVLTQQLKDHNALHMRWYLLAMAGQDPDGPIPDDAGT